MLITILARYALGRKKEQPKPDEPKSKDELLAVIWGSLQAEPAAYREAVIWYVLGTDEADRALGAIDQSTGKRQKSATGSDRDPWRGTEKAVLQLEARGINTLAGIVRRYIEGESPSPEVQAELDQIRATLGPVLAHA
jgi:hypothetical protein